MRGRGGSARMTRERTLLLCPSPVLLNERELPDNAVVSPARRRRVSRGDAEMVEPTGDTTGLSGLVLREGEILGGQTSSVPLRCGNSRGGTSDVSIV